MMDNNDLAQIPISKFISDNGLVCVWCTNSQSHIDSLKSTIFPAWEVQYVACWYWIKVIYCDYNYLKITYPSPFVFSLLRY